MATGDILTVPGTLTAMTITLASLATSAAGVGRQSTLVDNTSVKAPAALVYCKVTTGTTPTANTSILVYLIRYDNSAFGDDGCGTSDAALTIINAQLLGSILNPATTSNTAYYGVFDTAPFGPLGPKWGVAIVHNTGVNLNSTGGNHVIEYIAYNPQVQS